jgi:hypothetical protein
MEIIERAFTNFERLFVPVESTVTDLNHGQISLGAKEHSQPSDSLDFAGSFADIHHWILSI